MLSSNAVLRKYHA